MHTHMYTHTHTHTFGGPRLMLGLFSEGFCALFIKEGSLSETQSSRDLVSPLNAGIPGRLLGPPSIDVGFGNPNFDLAW